MQDHGKHMPSAKTNYSAKGLVFVGIILAALLSLYWVLNQTGMLAFLENSAHLKSWIEKQGPIGPLLIIGVMMIAIIMSPMPSAPIALASGAIYGHTFGTMLPVGKIVDAKGFGDNSVNYTDSQNESNGNDNSSHEANANDSSVAESNGNDSSTTEANGNDNSSTVHEDSYNQD